MSRERIVVVNFTRMGDVIQSGPLLRSLKQNARECELILIVFSSFAETARRLPMVDRVVAFDVDHLVGELDSRRGRWEHAYRDAARFFQDSNVCDADAVYNLAHTRQSAMLCALLRASVTHGMTRSPAGRIRVHGEWFAYLFSIMRERSLNPFNLVEIYQRFGEGAVRSDHLEFSVTNADRQEANALLTTMGLSNAPRYVVLQSGASSPARQWPADRFAAVAQALSKHGVRSVLTGSAAEQITAEAISRLSGGAAISIAGRTNVGVLAAVLEGAEKVLSNDTGTIHLAAAVGTPTVGVFIGPASAKDTAPYGNGHLILEPDLECAPCGYHDECRGRECGARIGVDHVLSALLGDPQDMDENESLWDGVRAYRTEVERNGRFRLRLLNHPRIPSDSRLLEGYREFWETLFQRPPDCVSSSEERLPARGSEDSEGLRKLAGIFRNAKQQVATLRASLEDGIQSSGRITTALSNQMVWQNALREFAERDLRLAPLPRYLIVRLSTVYGDEVNEYLSDLESIVETFGRGVRLLSAQERNRVEEVVHALA
ncbi:MAG: glycosyltransferase family 9 protein [bacterium]|nr:glycosyltransferase family 9 protein [bacterium]